jgi:SAM-dependent methyltransferase
LSDLAARLDIAEEKLEEKAREIAAQAEQRAQDFEAALEAKFQQLHSTVEERLTQSDAATNERLTKYEAAVDTRFQEYTTAIDARIEDRLRNVELRADERNEQLTESVNQTFEQRARALDIRVDDRFSHLERNMDQRMVNFEKGIDQRLYQREKFTDQQMVNYGKDVVARTDILLQQSEQRIDKLRRAMRFVLEAGKRETAIQENLAAFDQLTSYRRSFGDLAVSANAHLQENQPAAKALYHEIVEWKQTATDALNRFTPDEQEIVDYILSFTMNKDAEDETYVRDHLRRFIATLQRIPPPRRTSARVLELGSYELHFTPALKKFGGYSQIYCSDWSELDSGLTGQVTLKQRDGGEVLTFEVKNFNAERDRFPYADGYFSLVLCCEMLEHLAHDPMHMLWECNRVLEPEGYLLLTTPNLASARSLEGILLSCQPYLLSQYNVQDSARQHHREYTPDDVQTALVAAGFTIVALETDDVWAKSNPAVLQLLKQLEFSTEMRGDNIFALARKTSAPLERYPSSLYVGLPEPAGKVEDATLALSDNENKS